MLGAAALVLLGGCSAVERTAADRFVASGELIALSGGDAGAANACITCHGLDGRGNGAGTPRLAGLNQGYLAAQLEGYASGRRRHPEMEAISRQLAPAHRQAVSAYYARLPFAAAAGALPPGPAASLYQRGDPSRGLAACASCHGLRGEGVGPGNPPLAGQPAAYLSEQLDRWRASERRNDPEGVMLRISRLLSERESAALAAYAAALPGDPQRRESPEASPSERRDDSRNGASAPRPRAAE